MSWNQTPPALRNKNTAEPENLSPPTDQFSLLLEFGDRTINCS